MIAVGVLVTSIFLQLVAAGLVLRLIGVTGWRFTWTFAAAALALISLGRGVILYRVVVGEGAISEGANSLDLSTEFVALATSVLMVTVAAFAGPLLARAKGGAKWGANRGAKWGEGDPRRGAAEVQRLNEELTNLVEERTSELHAAREALVRVQSLAALGERTGSVAHDLRNPLGAIAISIDVIQDKCEAADVDVDRALGRVRRNIRRCDGLIDELLDFTRVKELCPEPTDLDVWLSDVLGEQLVPNSVTVSRELRAGGATVAFDREQIRRAVINLMENAFQAMTLDDGGADVSESGVAGRRELVVTTRRLEGRIEIEVADTGPGIPEHHLAKVREPLFSTKVAGTGLGLSIVQRIMERHSGGLEIASAIRRGTRACLWLPIEQGAEQGNPA